MIYGSYIKVNNDFHSGFRGGEVDFKWSEVNLERVETDNVPTCSGIYVIKQVERVMGLPVSHEIIYVGKSNNLRRRFKEHCNPRSEHNNVLLNASWKNILEFWFAKIEVENLDEIERKLINNLEPITNIVRYKG